LYSTLCREDKIPLLISGGGGGGRTTNSAECGKLQSLVMNQHSTNKWACGDSMWKCDNGS